ncbi:MAG: 2,3-bisphosphoglycerate-dependent phosphoglycerate mutase [Minisyncoccia bacterium]
MIGKIILARHHESEWNKLGKWTGSRDVHLTPYGFEKAGDMGLLLNDIKVDCAFASMQVRSIETLSCMLNICERHDVPTEHNKALNERDYGDYTGKNKWEIKEKMGEAEFNKLRREWNYPVPNGETLKMVYERAVPYYLDSILSKAREGKNVLIVSHGNTLRSIMKYIEDIPDEKIGDVEMPFGAILIYEVDEKGKKIKREDRNVESIVPA